MSKRQSKRQSKPWRLEPGERGTPYSLAEAKIVVEQHKGKMDEYHREVMGWLCDEVERLHKAFCPPPQVNKREFLLKNSLAEHLFISAFAKAFPKFVDSGAKELIDAKTLSLVLVANGVPMDAIGVCVEWEKQIDWMVAKKASELIKEKFYGLTETLDRAKEAFERHVKDEMRKAGISEEE